MAKKNGTHLEEAVVCDKVSKNTTSQAFNSSTWEAEVRGLLLSESEATQTTKGVQGQPEPHGEILSQNDIKRTNKQKTMSYNS